MGRRILYAQKALAGRPSVASQKCDNVGLERGASQKWDNVGSERGTSQRGDNVGLERRSKPTVSHFFAPHGETHSTTVAVFFRRLFQKCRTVALERAKPRNCRFREEIGRREAQGGRGAAGGR